MGRYLFHFHERIWKPVWIFYLKIKGILIQRKKLNTKKPLQNPTIQQQNPKTNKQNQNQPTKPTQPNPSKNLKALGICKVIDGGCQEKQRWKSQLKASWFLIQASHLLYTSVKPLLHPQNFPFIMWSAKQFITQWRGSFLVSFGKTRRNV